MPYRDEIASILIVDDRPEKLLALEAVLEELGQQIVCARSGRDALRQVRQRDFAVILLDVNMPGMDGFETAALIRQRRSCQHVPIIFITAFGDEMHASRGYSLGAVDYMLTPVLPDVLRTKVAVFVDLFRKSEQVKRQASWQAQRADQLQKLAAASVAIHGAMTIRDMLETINQTARDIVGSHQSITLFNGESHPGTRPGKVEAITSFSDKYAVWRHRSLPLAELTSTIVAGSPSSTRMNASQLHAHPDWERVRELDIPPIHGGILAVPMGGRDGRNLGLIYLSDRIDGDFTEDDEAVLVQLAQMGSIAIENTLYSQEREANRLKDEFLATLSHELRTPLNAIMGWTQLLRMNGFKNNLAHGMEVIERNVKAQTRLVEDLLDVSRITTGKMKLSVQPTLLAPIILSAADSIRPALEAKNIHIDCMVDDLPNVTVMGDADRLQQVVWNLLSNAAKFTPAQGNITVALEHDGEQVHVHVVDTGQGIEGKFLPYVFDRFRQADSSSTRLYGGLGIGLTVVRHIVELHGGSVRADSHGPGEGATFTITLPLAACAIRRHGNDAQVPPVAGGADPAVTPAMLSNVRVLLVDDEADAREVIAEILRRFDAQVVTVASAGEAIDCLDRQPIDILLSDIAMPGEDGYALMRQVRRLSPGRGGSLPAIALTAYARDEDRCRALEAGFQAHLCKPVEPAQLAAAVAKLVPTAAACGGASGDVPAGASQGSAPQRPAAREGSPLRSGA